MRKFSVVRNARWAHTRRMEQAPGEPTVDLAEDHPGVHDAAYLARRRAIAAAAGRSEPHGTIEDVDYTSAEDDVWRLVSSQLASAHQRMACAAYRRGAERLALPAERVPQLRAVDQRLAELTGFRLQPVAGLVPIRRFYGALAGRRFLATQYIRHHSAPFYTPEPDVVHEVIGHAAMLASPPLADLYQAAGRAAERTCGDPALEFFSRVFWFTLEFGVVEEQGHVRAYGAGLLSSYGELAALGRAALRPFDPAVMGRTGYDITTYQPVLFVAPSFGEMVDGLSEFFDAYDDECYLRLTAGSADSAGSAGSASQLVR